MPIATGTRIVPYENVQAARGAPGSIVLVSNSVDELHRLAPARAR